MFSFKINAVLPFSLADIWEKLSIFLSNFDFLTEKEENGLSSVTSEKFIESLVFPKK